jgi:uncharacterized protein YbbC (DUF1343 family)
MLARTGLDLFEKRWSKKLAGARAGLLVHPASVNRSYEDAAALFMRSKKIKLKALFGPQHGILGETQDNMVEWRGFKDRKTGIPVYSLYGVTRKPTPRMLAGLDLLVIDMQDVGSRYYTFIWTMELCMQACAEAGISVVILDRPNPLGGSITEGPVLDMDFTSFVGQRPLPVRHGMTVGEFAIYLKESFCTGLDLHIIKMQGWKRNSYFDETGLPWVMPSPNMPALDTAMVYPGMCLLEGTNLSEGRGTTRPFEIFGAPFIDPDAIVKRLNSYKLPGIFFRPLHFQPTFQKHGGRLCGGAQLHVTGRKSFKPFKTGVAILKAVHDLYPKKFRWNNPPYEYEKKKMPIDILAGTDRLRKDIEEGRPLGQVEKWWQDESQRFNRNVRRKYLLYE